MKNSKTIEDLKETFLLNVKEINLDEWKDFNEKYQVTIEDIDLLFNKIITNYNNKSFKKLLLNWNTLFNREANYLLEPSIKKSNALFEEDLFFRKENNLIILGLCLLLLKCDLEKIIENYIIFTNIKLSNAHNEYPKDDLTIKFLLARINKFITNEEYSRICKVLSMEDVDFYRENTIRLANNDDYDVKYNYAYELYEGSVAFDVNYQMAKNLFIELFEERSDPFIANTLGYIYYYDRLQTNEKDKAFTYFSLAHNIDPNITEATYKLADCYLKGYGTIKSEVAAFSLVSSTYDELREETNHGHFYSKFADICIRLGKYLKEGIGCERDDHVARLFFLQARAALKYRIDNMNYIGDKGLAYSLFNSLKEYSVEREIVDKKYYKLNEPIDSITINNPSLAKRDGKNICYCRKYNNKNNLFVNEIAYFKYQNSAEIVLVLKDSTQIEKIEDLNNYEKIICSGNKVYFYKNSKNKRKDAANLVLDIDYILFKPELEKLDKNYLLLEVSFEKSDKTYLYLYERDEEIKDIVNISTQYGIKEAKVINKYYLYEDELPLPLNKINKIN